MRLLYEGQGLLQYGKLEFPLPYADFLLDIREGIYKYDEILQMSNDEKAKLDLIESTLPMKPNEDELLEVYYALYGMGLEE